MPKTALGAVAMLFAASVGAAFSGAVLFAYYQSQLQDVEDKVDRTLGASDEALEDAIAEIEAERDAARAEIRRELEPLQELQATRETLQQLAEQVAPSVYWVVTRDAVGQPSVGSAFVVASDGEQSFLLTSLAVVRAATGQPGPDIELRKGEEALDATLWTWDEARDLALVIVRKANIPRLAWAPTDPPLGIGQRVFAVAGVGGAGASISQGFVTDVSSAGVQHDAPVSGAFVGGPVVNSKGEVIGVASRAYEPLGFSSEEATYAPPVRTACDRVLRCPSDEGGEPGARR